MLDTPTNQTIPDFCQEVLRKRFPSELGKQTIIYSDNKLNFACPYCGDSEKTQHKKRGHLYLETGTYKCYNDGCAVWIPVEKFISNFSQKYKIPLPNFNKAKLEFKPQTSNKRRGFLIEFLINNEVGEKLLDINILKSRFGLIPCSTADPLSPIGKFIELRKINKLPIFEHSCYYDHKQDKIFIFNLDIKSGKILGFAMRRIDDQYIGPKYNIKNYSEFKKTGLIKNLDSEFISEIESLNNYFNILNIDFSKLITVTEGQIDSFFIKNCIATTGVTKSKALLNTLITKKNSRILFDNDKAGKTQSIELIKNGYSVFLWNSTINFLKLKYPSDLRKIKSIKDINDLYRFLLEMDNTMDFDKFNKFIDTFFSSSAFDLISI